MLDKSAFYWLMPQEVATDPLVGHAAIEESFQYGLSGSGAAVSHLLIRGVTR